MMFRTQYKAGVPAFRLPVPFHGLFIGSCFAERLGNRYADAAFPAIIQPTGTVYHPLPLLWQLKWMNNETDDTAEMQVTSEGLVRNLMFHSRFAHEGVSGVPRDVLRSDFGGWINSSMPVLMVTFGTATGYRHLGSGRLVANCHKLPGREFEKELVPHEEMALPWKEWLERMFAGHPELKVILSVSPVRHLSDGMELNMLSKSHLRILCSSLAATFPDQVAYFPAFEILMDDLRDYRFYGDDLIHPTELASAYITNLFTGEYLGKEGTEWLQAWEQIQRLARHRPLHENQIAFEARMQSIHKLASPFRDRADVDATLFRWGIKPNSNNIHPSITT